ncbi:MAG: glycosyltransferase family 39 protein [Trichloromonas sp.]|jgi:4-amino-4-deoxy-L-arabinose transferase-like glycosyltransferase|nr:glycosyltransferase family 39 protein [Trichloromonas sp.]
MSLTATSLESNDWLNRLDARRMVWLLLGLSLIIKISIWVQSPVITPDGPVYIAQAEEFLRGDWQKGLALNGSLFIYPLMIAGLGLLGADLVVAGQLLSLLFSVSTVIPLFLLTRRLFDTRAAFWATLAFVAAPSLNEFAVYVMRDPGFLCMFAWALYFSFRAVKEEDVRAFFLSLAFSFMAFLFRIEAFFLPFLLVLFIFCNALYRWQWRTRFIRQVGIFLFVLSLAISVAGWVFSDQILRFNRLGLIVSMMKMPLNKGIFGCDPRVQEELRKLEKVIPMGTVDNDFAEIARENIRLIYFIGLMANVKKVLYPAFFAACLVGLVSFRNCRSSHALLIWLTTAYLLILYLYLLHSGFIETRYVYVPVFLLLPWVGYGIERILDRLKKTKRLPQFAPLLLVSLLFVVPGVEAATEVKRQLISAKKAGQWLAARPEINVGPLIANHRETPFYSGRGMDFIETTQIDAEHLSLVAQNNSAQLIAVLRDLGAEPAELHIENFVQVEKFADKRYETLIFRKQDEPSGN